MSSGSKNSMKTRITSDLLSMGELLERIGNGQYQIPRFQRDFIWKREKVALLFDSILKGYPVGTMTLWETTYRLESVKEFGGKEIVQPEEGERRVYYVLDGQQRLTSLLLACEGYPIQIKKM